jgi:hypothetical protein
MVKKNVRLITAQYAFILIILDDQEHRFTTNTIQRLKIIGATLSIAFAYNVESKKKDISRPVVICRSYIHAFTKDVIDFDMSDCTIDVPTPI